MRDADVILAEVLQVTIIQLHAVRKPAIVLVPAYPPTRRLLTFSLIEKGRVLHRSTSIQGTAMCQSTVGRTRLIKHL